MAGFFLFVVVVGAGLFAFYRSRAPTSFSSMSGAPSPRVQTFADGMPEASIAGQKADLEDGARTGRAREGDNRLSAISAMLTWAEEPMILERNKESLGLKHPRTAITNICLAAHLSNNQRFDVDIALYPLIRRMETAGDAAGI